MGWRTDFEGARTVGGARVARIVREELFLATGLAERIEHLDPVGWSEATVNDSAMERVRRRLDLLPGQEHGTEAALPPRYRLADELGVDIEGWAESLPEDATDAETVQALEDRILSAVDRSDQGAEVFEWWIATSRLADLLEAQGEIVVRYEETAFWGRQSTGQAIAVDGVISGARDADAFLDAPPRGTEAELRAENRRLRKQAWGT